jgi:hypothetical protein
LSAGVSALGGSPNGESSICGDSSDKAAGRDARLGALQLRASHFGMRRLDDRLRGPSVSVDGHGNRRDLLGGNLTHGALDQQALRAQALRLKLQERGLLLAQRRLLLCQFPQHAVQFRTSWHLSQSTSTPARRCSTAVASTRMWLPAPEIGTS